MEILYIVIALILLYIGCVLLNIAFNIESMVNGLFVGMLAAIVITIAIFMPIFPVWGYLLNPVTWFK